MADIGLQIDKLQDVTVKLSRSVESRIDKERDFKNKLQAELQAISQQIETKIREITTEKDTSVSQLHDITEQHKDITEQHESVARNLSDKNTEYDKLTTIIEGKDESIRQLQEIISKKTAENETDNVEQTKQISLLTSQLDALQNDKTKLEQQIIEKDAIIADLESQVTTGKREAERIQKNLDDLNATADKAYKELEREKEDIEDHLHRTEAELAALNAAADKAYKELEREKDAVEDDLHRKEAELTALNETAEKEYRELQGEKDAVEENLHRVQQALIEKEAECATAETDSKRNFDTLQAEKVRVENEVLHAQEELKASTAEKTNLETQLGEARHRIEELENSVDELTKTVDELTAKLTLVTEEKDKCKEETDNLEGIIAHMRAQVDDLMANKTELEESKHLLTANIATQQAKLEEITGMVANIQKMINENPPQNMSDNALNVTISEIRTKIGLPVLLKDVQPNLEIVNTNGLPVKLSDMLNQLNRKHGPVYDRAFAEISALPMSATASNISAILTKYKISWDPSNTLTARGGSKGGKYTKKRKIKHSRKKQYSHKKNKKIYKSTRKKYIGGFIYHNSTKRKSIPFTHNNLYKTINKGTKSKRRTTY